MSIGIICPRDTFYWKMKMYLNVWGTSTDWLLLVGALYKLSYLLTCLQSYRLSDKTPVCHGVLAGRHCYQLTGYHTHAIRMQSHAGEINKLFSADDDAYESTLQSRWSHRKASTSACESRLDLLWHVRPRGARAFAWCDAVAPASWTRTGSLGLPSVGRRSWTPAVNNHKYKLHTGYRNHPSTATKWSRLLQHDVICTERIPLVHFLSMVTLTFALWPWHSNSFERGTKHVFPVNLAQMRSAVPNIFDSQTKNTTIISPLYTSTCTVQIENLWLTALKFLKIPCTSSHNKCSSLHNPVVCIPITYLLNLLLIISRGHSKLNDSLEYGLYWF